jgi:hypothetical protein
MDQSPSWEADSCSANKKYADFYGTRKVPDSRTCPEPVEPNQLLVTLFP